MKGKISAWLLAWRCMFLGLVVAFLAAPALSQGGGESDPWADPYSQLNLNAGPYDPMKRDVDTLCYFAGAAGKQTSTWRLFYAVGQADPQNPYVWSWDLIQKTNGFGDLVNTTLGSWNSSVNQGSLRPYPYETAGTISTGTAGPSLFNFYQEFNSKAKDFGKIEFQVKANAYAYAKVSFTVPSPTSGNLNVYDNPSRLLIRVLVGNGTDTASYSMPSNSAFSCTALGYTKWGSGYGRNAFLVAGGGSVTVQVMSLSYVSKTVTVSVPSNAPAILTLYWNNQAGAWLSNQQYEAGIVPPGGAGGGSGGSGGSGGGESGGGFPSETSWWSDLFSSLFVPSDTTQTSWRDFINEIRNWGPFGVITSFQTSFNGAAVTGWTVTQDQQLSLGPIIPGAPADAVIDFSAPEQNGNGLPGSPDNYLWMGVILRYARALIGWAVYVFWVVALWKWLRPRFAL